MGALFSVLLSAGVEAHGIKALLQGLKYSAEFFCESIVFWEPAAQAPQARRPRHRDRLARPSGLRRRLAGNQSVPQNRHLAATRRRPIMPGAKRPLAPAEFNLQRVPRPVSVMVK